VILEFFGAFLVSFMSLRKRSRENDSVNALQIFFEDVARTPIVNGKSDYLPLLRRIRRATTLHKLTAKTHEVTLQKVTQKFLETVDEFNQQCQALNRPSLDLEKLAIEMESFLENPQQDMPPALVRCLGRSTWQQEDEVMTHFVGLGWRSAYLSSLLPCYMHSLRAPLSYSQEAGSLFEKICDEGRIAKNRLVEGTLRYVITIAYHYIGKGVPYLDLIQEGVLGLYRSTELFDEKKGVHFQVYAATWIRQYIARYLADKSRLIRVPVHAHEKAAEIERILTDFIEKQNNPATEIEIFTAMGWLTQSDCSEISQQKRKIKLQKQVQEYQRLFNYCTKRTKDITAFRWPTVFGLYTMSQQLRVRNGDIPSPVEILNAMNWFTEEQSSIIEELASDGAHLGKGGSKPSKLKLTAEQIQRRRLKNKNVPLYLWPKVLKLEQTQWELTKLTGIEPSSLQVFQTAGWLTIEDVELIKQHQSNKHALALSTETEKKLAKARQQMRYYHVANAIHFSLESTNIKVLPDDESQNIATMLISERSLKDAVNSEALINAVGDVMSNLSERERDVIVLRLGLNDGREHTLEEIAQPLGLTRERIRQVESKALRKLKHPLRIKKLKDFADFDSGDWENNQSYQKLLLRGLDPIGESMNDEDYIIREKKFIKSLIQRYITGSRRKIWDTRHQNSRAELLREVLETLNQPVHYSEIHTKALALIPESLQFSKKITYATLFYRTDYFRPFGNAIFGLTSWSTYSTETNGEQIFQHCPTPLLPTNPYITSFFESIMVGRELLKRKSLTAHQFWTEMAAWAKSTTLTKTEGQNAFDAWYAAGLLSPIDFLNNSDSLLELTIPTDAKLNEVRKHCLNALCRRVLKMSELLLTIDRIARPNIAAIQKVLFGSERSGFDLSARLEVLAAFEAIQSDGGEWHLTDLGRVILETNPPQELPDFGEIEAFQESVEPAVQVEWDEELGLLDI